MQAKRLRGLTKEPADICKEKGIIDDDQYAAAMHFRWLYTLRFGAPTISAINLLSSFGREIAGNDEKWQAAREKEYALAVKSLRECGALKIVMNITLFNYLPHFLRRRDFSRQEHLHNRWQLAQFREGLSLLAELFKSHI